MNSIFYVESPPVPGVVLSLLDVSESASGVFAGAHFVKTPVLVDGVSQEMFLNSKVSGSVSLTESSMY